MPLNRPFDAARQTNISGSWSWVNNPQVCVDGGGEVARWPMSVFVEVGDQLHARNLTGPVQVRRAGMCMCERAGRHHTHF